MMKLTKEDHDEIRNMLKNSIFALNDKNYDACKKFAKDTVEFLDMKSR